MSDETTRLAHQWRSRTGKDWTRRTKSDLCGLCGHTPDSDAHMAADAALAGVTVGGEGLREDAEKWRAAEAEGHTVDFSDEGYGLQHPPSCRPDLIGCRFNVFLADYGEPVMEPGRYRMTWSDGDDMPTFAAHQSDTPEAEG